ncbi:winged helix-turn-helix transcriptional regulator [Bacillus sp. H-16]|uniref:ArsR/SmtB family transcription factor n=1 Tax=Alteribacter salitolerans TaxID=2912333 RepID=UPI0019649AC3|nr:winged helix-turn-helix domain-containing protein [Alteribacter salitolerans]MBM7096956.1 winged helix-turn-helix transcriptional regulator [Alteribacter salitolerans]
MNVISVFHPQFEFFNSLLDYLNTTNYKRIDLGKKWAGEVQNKVGESFLELVDNNSDLHTHLHFIHMAMISKEVHTGQTPEDLFSWLKTYEPSQIGDSFLQQHDLKAPVLLEKEYELLSLWNNRYYNDLEPILSPKLIEVERKANAIISSHTPVQAINLITNGLVLEGDLKNLTVYLLPQYHGRPVLFYKHTNKVHIYGYAADSVTLTSDEVAPVLIRTQQALGDENRLKMLQFIEKKPCTFKDIHTHINLAKSTVHHHLLALRSSGLINVHQPLGKHVWYSYRPHGIRNLEKKLTSFIKGGELHE